MSQISFKNFSTFVDLNEEPSPEQLQELFGLFRNNEKLNAIKKKKEELKAAEEKKKKEISQAKDAAFAKRRGEIQNPSADPLQRGTNSSRSVQAANRAADLEWGQSPAAR